MPHLSFRTAVPVTDASVRVGNRYNQVGIDKAELLREMDRHGVGRAVAWHARHFISPIEANRQIMDLAAHEPRIIPLFSAVPLDVCIADLRHLETDRKLTAVRWGRIYENPAPFSDWFAGPLFEFLIETRTPLWVNWEDVTPDQFVQTARRFPKLRIVITGFHWSQHVYARPLMRTLPRVTLELSRYEILEGIEALIAEFGFDRFVYGSGFPDYAMGPALFGLHQIQLPEDQLKGLCHDNVDRLLAREGAA